MYTYLSVQNTAQFNLFKKFSCASLLSVHLDFCPLGPDYHRSEFQDYRLFLLVLKLIKKLGDLIQWSLCTNPRFVGGGYSWNCSEDALGPVIESSPLAYEGWNQPIKQYNWPLNFYRQIYTARICFSAIFHLVLYRWNAVLFLLSVAMLLMQLVAM